MVRLWNAGCEAIPNGRLPESVTATEPSGFAEKIGGSRDGLESAGEVITTIDDSDVGSLRRRVEHDGVADFGAGFGEEIDDVVVDHDGGHDDFVPPSRGPSGKSVASISTASILRISLAATSLASCLNDQERVAGQSGTLVGMILIDKARVPSGWMRFERWDRRWRRGWRSPFKPHPARRHSRPFVDQDHSVPGSALPGDPLLVIKQLAKDVAAKEIRKIEGRVLIDATLFPDGPREGRPEVVMSSIMIKRHTSSISSPNRRQSRRPHRARLFASNFLHPNRQSRDHFPGRTPQPSLEPPIFSANPDGSVASRSPATCRWVLPRNLRP